jgi:PQQ-dependent dehydrogenase (methanol/ethanol family)
MPASAKRSSRARRLFCTAMLTTGAIVTGAASGAEAAAAPASEWRLIGLNAEQQHFSPLEQINDKNISELGLAWAADMPTVDGLVGVPLVADGTVYQSGPMGRVYANDVRTGRPLWTFDAHPIVPGQLITAWGNRTNRGVALWQDKVYVGTGDCRIVAIDRKHGTKVWEAQSCDPANSYAIPGAPRVGGGKVFTGNANGDSGANRGFVDAFDATSGRHLWRFYTIPGDPAKGFENKAMEMASKTWGKEYWKKTGGGVVWDALTYDPVLNLLYIGTDGATPFNPSLRGEGAGDELFTTSIIALNADTGAYVWHYQTTPHDAWNYDATMHIMIAELSLQGAKRRVVMQAPKNGFFYVLDAKTGALISARNIVPVNWASGIDPKTGRPNVLAGARWYEHPDKPTLIAPSPIGAHSWQPMSYSPLTGLVYIPVMEQPMELIPIGDNNAVGGSLDINFYTGQGDRSRFKGELIAWDPIQQKTRWQHTVGLPQNGGVLSTAGNLVFQGTSSGELHAYQADSGKPLWSSDTDSGVYAAPSTVEIDGEQLLLVATGSGTASAILTYPRLGGKTRGPSRLLAFKLGGKAVLPASTATVEVFPKPAQPRQTTAMVAKGRAIWDASGCELCHGYTAIGPEQASVPDLRKSAAVTSDLFAGIVLGGLNGPKGMPSFRDSLKAEDLPALRAFIVNQAWNAYEAQETALRSKH